jgi:hypothetical protein
VDNAHGWDAHKRIDPEGVPRLVNPGLRVVVGAGSAAGLFYDDPDLRHLHHKDRRQKG